MLGLISIPKDVNENQPTTVKIKNITIVGTGFLIDQAEILKDIGEVYILDFGLIVSRHWSLVIRNLSSDTGELGRDSFNIMVNGNFL
jgi:hypothetical protein